MENLNVVKMQTKNELRYLEIQKKIDLASGMIKGLKPMELKVFCQQLRDLSQFFHEFVCDIKDILRIQREDAVEAKVLKIRDLGLTFDSIVIDDIRFYIDDNGQLTKGFSEDDIPF